MTADQIIEGVLEREQQGTPPYLAKNDAGGRTSWGISERAHPEAWLHGPPSRAAAKLIYADIYVMPFYALSTYSDLCAAVIDDAVMSGVSAATKRLQVVLRVKPDGVIGEETIAALRRQIGGDLVQRYVVERAIRLTRLVQTRPSDLTNLTGWITRVLSFLPEAR